MVGLFTTHITEGQGLLEGYTRRGFLHEMHKATGLRKAVLKYSTIKPLYLNRRKKKKKDIEIKNLASYYL